MSLNIIFCLFSFLAQRDSLTFLHDAQKVRLLFCAARLDYRKNSSPIKWQNDFCCCCRSLVRKSLKDVFNFPQNTRFNFSQPRQVHDSFNSSPSRGTLSKAGFSPRFSRAQARASGGMKWKVPAHRPGGARRPTPLALHGQPPLTGFITAVFSGTI